MTTPHKVVDGEEVPLSEAEIAQRKAEATAYAQAQLVASARRQLLLHIDAEVANDETLQRLTSMSAADLDAWLLSDLEMRSALRLLLLLELRRHL